MNEKDSWTLPWGIEVLQRLKTAQRNTKEAFERAPKNRDLHQGTEIANHWAVATLCYSGIEQSFKVTIASERGVTAEQRRKEGGKKYRTHDVGCLFSSMDESARELLSEYYPRFQSLHNYIDLGDLQDFLNQISGPSGSGYERWRYSLVETGRGIPRISVECMLSIWGATVELIESRQYPDRGNDVLMPDDEPRQAVHASFHDATDDDIESLNDSTDQHSSDLSAIAELLWKRRRGIRSEADGADWLSRFLCRTLSMLAEESRIGRRRLGVDKGHMEVAELSA